MATSPPTSDAPARSPKRHIPELDVLRGLAAVLMVMNHLAARILAPTQLSGGLLSAIFFVGSFAPVLFFFVTGVGSGIQSQSKQKASRWGSVLNKVAILIGADLLMHWSAGQFVGLDFLGFIGLSMLVMEFVRLQARPLVVCGVGMALLSIVRYGVAPILTKRLGYQSDLPLVNWVLSMDAVPNVSYPLSPWMVYPLLGFMVGAIAVRHWQTILDRRWRVVGGLLAAGLVPALVGGWLAVRGNGFFRWGTVNFNFYFVSFAAIAFGLALALALCARPTSLQHAIALPGIASLAVVPLHYLLIGWVFSVGIKQPSEVSFLLLLLILSATAFLGARGVEVLSLRVAKLEQPQMWSAIVGATLLLAVVTLLLGQSSGTGGNMLPLLSRTAAQLLLCLLLLIPAPWQRPTRQRA